MFNYLKKKSENPTLMLHIMTTEVYFKKIKNVDFGLGEK